ncbi:unnamed protein product [Dracunculus medinensis]|uniref:G_PROTEIN_RECEP_F1_2 domain-containing protein n=1 Tax=Dracunculus medinensis TaxID=318479 RepID=A0A158Q5F5_DRAME|nr:unnamed protein product [Dracunculus medinensis]
MGYELYYVKTIAVIKQWQIIKIRITEYLTKTALSLGTEDNVSIDNLSYLMAIQSLCAFLTKRHVDFHSENSEYFRFVANTSDAINVSLLNRITYAYIAPIIIVIGIIGDIMTVATLTHPILRRSSIIYTYLILLALTDLLTHLSIIPMILWLLDWRLCSYPSALYYAHIGFPLVNALMGVSVWIVVFLTMSQYMAVCHPFRYSYLRSRKTCFWLSGLAYIINFCIYIPWATKKAVSFEVAQCKFVVCEHQIELWFKVYEWTRETISRLLPFVLLAYFNSKILITYRNTKQDRLRCLASNTQKGSIGVKSEKEERRLFILLFSIVIIFFICTIPAAPLTIFVSDSRSRNLSFQIIRAIINVMEFTKFALNFYFYCLINPDIRRVCIVLARCEKISRQPRIKVTVHLKASKKH